MLRELFCVELVRPVVVAPRPVVVGRLVAALRLEELDVL